MKSERSLLRTIEHEVFDEMRATYMHSISSRVDETTDEPYLHIVFYNKGGAIYECALYEDGTIVGAQK